MAEPVEASEALKEGAEIAGFRVIRKLGEGGMGAVYLAEQVRLRREIALKVLHRRLVSKNREYVGRFLREAALAAKVNHPNVVQVIDAGESGGVYFLAMERVTGRTVLEMLKAGGAFPEAAALEVARQGACALEAARRQNLVHRDIKPDNLILTREGVVKVADFGLAKNTAATTQFTQAGVIMGTPAYMSPEQVQGAPADHASDLYSLGISLYEMAVGEKPFHAETVVALLMKHVMETVPDPRIADPSLSAGLAAVLARLTARDPAQRIRTASDLLRELEALPRPPDGRKVLAALLERRFPPGSEDSAPGRSRVLTEALRRAGDRDFEAALAPLEGGGATREPAAPTRPVPAPAPGTRPPPEKPASASAKTRTVGPTRVPAEAARVPPPAEGASPAEARGRPSMASALEEARRAVSASDLPGARRALAEARRLHRAEPGYRSMEEGLEKEIEYLEAMDRGRAAQLKGNWTEALESFGKARALFDRTEARAGLARARFKVWSDRAEEARGDGEARKELKFLRQARSALQSEGLSPERTFEERLETLEQDLGRRKGIRDSLQEGKDYESAGNWSRARSAYRQALDLVPGDTDKALLQQRLAQVARLEDRHLDHLLVRARALALQGECRRAGEALSAYLSVRAADPAARQWLQALAALPEGARADPSGPQPLREAEWAADGAALVFVPGGPFLRGSDQSGKDERPAATVESSPFWIDREPVTNARYARFLEWARPAQDPHRFCHPEEPEGKDHVPELWSEPRWNDPGLPVVGIDWFDAFAYASWAGKVLPSEAQWEKAARGPGGRTYPWGEAPPSPERCNFADTGTGRTSPPGERPAGASPFGALDMAGNVMEWCRDYYDPSFYSRPASREKDPENREPSPKRALRGGAWISSASCCQATFRDADFPLHRNNYVGFRCVLKAPG